jgi:hypothetical protein
MKDLPLATRCRRRPVAFSGTAKPLAESAPGWYMIRDSTGSELRFVEVISIRHR